MGTETGSVLLRIGGKELECEFERYVEEEGEGGGTGYFVVTRATLVCSAFVGHDPVRIDLTRFFQDLGVGVCRELDALAELSFLSSDTTDEAGGDGYREDEDDTIPPR